VTDDSPPSSPRSNTRLGAALRAGGALGLAAALATATVSCGDDDAATTAGGPAETTETTVAPVIDPGDGGHYDPDIDPAAFVDGVDNPHMPLVPGSRWVYDGIEDGESEHIEVVVTDERREVMGISAVVVRDTVSTGGEVIEDTYDWFAQDRDGNVWYLGEETMEYEDGKPVSDAGSWEAGVDGALPGIVMPANPAVGDAYRQEYYEGEAEDMGEVVELGAEESVPYGSFDDLLVTKDWNPLEPDTVEEKYYAAGIGVVLEVKTEGGDGRIELIDYTPAS
jgi:hypothetical protein